MLLFLLAVIPLIGRISAPTPPPASVRSGGDRAEVAFVGDSLTAGGEWEQAFPRLRVVNLGVGGDTSRDLLARLPALRAAGARTYVVMVGINDIRRGAPAPAVAARIERLRLALGRDGARVLIQSTIPCERSRCGGEAVDRVEALNRRLRRQTPAGDFIDLRPAFGGRDGLPAAYSVDGVHLSPAGYRRWEELLAPRLPAPR